MNQYLVGLKDAKAQSLSVSGGKGASLARLHGISDIPVPDGFVVTTQCFMEIVWALPEIKTLLGALAKVTEDQTGIIRNISGQMKEHIEHITFPASFTSELDETLSAYGRIFFLCCAFQRNG